jgi:hypothetical protein
MAGAAGKRAVKSTKKAAQNPDDLQSQAAVEGVVYKVTTITFTRGGILTNQPHKVSDLRIVVSVEAELQDVELPERCRVWVISSTRGLRIIIGPCQR